MWIEKDIEGDYAYGQEFRSIEYWKPHFHKDAVISLDYHTVNDKTKLLVIVAKNPKAVDKRPVIMFSGWAALVDAWTDVLRVISKHTSIYYIESREKSSSILPDHNVSMSIEQMADDLEVLFPKLGINLEETVFLSSSLGGTQLLEYLTRGNTLPYASIMIGPNAEFHYPWIINIILKIPLSVIRPIKGVVKWYLRNFRIDMEREPKQYQKYADTIDNADDWKIRQTARECLAYKAWEKLDQISEGQKIILVGAKADKMHKAEMTERIHKLVEGSTYSDFPTNKATHSEEMGRFVLKYI